MKIFFLLLACVLAAYAQTLSEVTTYYSSDSQCRTANVIGALARIVNTSACVEQPCNLVANTNFYRQISCRQTELVVPVLNWPTYYVYNNDQCSKGSLTEFFFSKPGTCHPIVLRGVPVFVTASCYPWGTGATFCADGCGGVQCMAVNGTQTCTNIDFTFTSGWILGQCATGPTAPVAAPVAAPVVVTPPLSTPTAAPVATNAPGVIPAVQIPVSHKRRSDAPALLGSFTLCLALLVLFF